MNGYSQRILAYAANNRYTGSLEGADGIGEVGLDNGRQGSTIAARFMLRLDVQQQRILQLRYQAFGCGYTLAACAAAAELAEHSLISDAVHINRGVIDQRLGGLPEERSYCAALAADALQAAVAGAQRQIGLVNATFTPEEHAAPRVSENHPFYRQLMDSLLPADVASEDRHLLACLLVVARQEQVAPAAALGLPQEQLDRLCRRLFPVIGDLTAAGRSALRVPPDVNPALRDLLQGFVPALVDGQARLLATSLARILAARAVHPGHLWVAMGLFERDQLSAAIRRHLPALAAANNQEMRWKRFFYRQLCALSGGHLCQTPVCGDCPEYSRCFVQS